MACSIQSMNHALGALVIEQKLAADAATAAVKVRAMRHYDVMISSSGTHFLFRNLAMMLCCG
jgi:hypothetical protein